MNDFRGEKEVSAKSRGRAGKPFSLPSSTVSSARPLGVAALVSLFLKRRKRNRRGETDSHSNNLNACLSVSLIFVVQDRVLDSLNFEFELVKNQILGKKNFEKREKKRKVKKRKSEKERGGCAARVREREREEEEEEERKRKIHHGRSEREDLGGEELT